MKWLQSLRSDTRVLILVFFAILSRMIMETPGFARTWQQFALAATILLSLDMFSSYRVFGRIKFPLSGIVSSFGVAVMIDSPVLWPTALAAALCSLSKYLIRFRGRHIFNPNNFGIVVVTAAFPDWAVIGGNRWGGDPSYSLLLFFVGILIVWHARRWALVLTYLVAFLSLNLARAFVMHVPYWSFSLSILGPAMQLFMFYMMTDPKTSPNSLKEQVQFGILLAALDNVLRHFEFRDAPLVALFLIGIARALPLPMSRSETSLLSGLTLSKT